VYLVRHLPLVVVFFLIFAAAQGGVNSWSAAGPGLEDVTAVEIDPSDSRIIYLVARSHKVFRSTSGGAEWQQSELPASLITIALRAVPGHPGFVYVAAQHVSESRTSSVLLSADYGVTWQPRGTFHNGDLKALQVDPRQPNVVYIGTNGGVFKTTDSGLSWSLLGSPAGVESLAVDHFNSNLLYAGTASESVWRSTDGGGTWVKSKDGFLPRHARVESLASDAAAAGTVYAGLGGGGIYRSTDGGERWQCLPAAVANSHLPSILPLADTQRKVFLLSRGTESRGLYRTSDAGLTWSRIALPFLPTSGLAITAGDASTIYVGSAEGVAKTNDAGASWRLMNPGLRTTRLGGISQGAENVLYAWDYYGRQAYRSSDLAQSWVALARIVEEPYVEYRIKSVYASPLDPAFAAAVLSQGGIGVGGTGSDLPGDAEAEGGGAPAYLTRDKGAHWEAVQGLTGFVTTLLFDAARLERLYVAGSQGLLRSDDGGLSWGRPSASPQPYAIESLVQHPSRPETLLASTTWDGLWKSEDAGATWTQLSPRLDSCQFYPPEISPSNGSVMLSIGCQGTRRSDDGGVTWKPIEPGLPPDSWVSAVRFHPVTGHAFLGFVNWGGAGGLMRSTDGGLTWATVATGGSSNPVDLLVSRGPGITLWTLDQDYGVFAYTFAGSPGNASFESASNESPAALERRLPRPVLAAGGNLAFAAELSTLPSEWARIGPSSGAVGEVVGDPFEAGTIYLEQSQESESGYWVHLRSEDGGASWETWSTGEWWNLSFGAKPGLWYRIELSGQSLSRSTDGGKSWQSTDLEGVGRVIPDPVDAQVIWALRYNSVDRSTDGGASWKTVRHEPGMTRMAIDPKATGSAFVGGTRYGYGPDISLTLRTTDAGQTWSVAGIREPEDILVDPDRPGHVYLADRLYGILKSTDHGFSWTPANEGLPRAEAWRLGYDPAERTLYCGVSPSAKGTVFKSADGAVSWQPTSPSLEDAISSLVVTAPGCLVARASSGIYRTTDAGKTWTRSEEGLPMPAVFGVSVTPAAPDLIYIQTDAGLFRGDSGGRWTPTNPELEPGETVTQLSAVPTDGSLLLASTPTMLYLSRDRGDNWTELFEAGRGLIAHVSAAPEDQKTLYVTVIGNLYYPATPPACYAAMYRSTDTGQTWAALPIDEDACTFEPVITRDGRLFLLQLGNLWRSTDRGDTWTRASELPVQFRRIVGAPSAVSVLYGFDDRTVWESRDSGDSWTQVAEFPAPAKVTSLVVDPLNSDRLYVSAGAVFLLTPSSRSVRPLVSEPLPMLQMVVLPWRRMLLGAPGAPHEGLYVTGTAPPGGRPRRATTPGPVRSSP